MPPSDEVVSRTRRAERSRETKETRVRVTLDLDGPGQAVCSTGLPFFDHMLEQLGRHGGIDLSIEASGDLEVDAHHTVEDVGIVLGEALAGALADKGGIRRFGWAIVPLDEAASQVALDLSGRPYLLWEVDPGTERIGSFDPQLAEEFMRAFVTAGGITLHVRMLSGKNPHHILESAFKGVARALSDALAPDPRRDQAAPSTKGAP
jgi:imidazoleglycerol-phosphate dehydratase